MIVAVAVVQGMRDKRQLVGMVEQVCYNLVASPEAVSADVSYWVEEDVERLEWCKVDAYVARQRMRHRERREAARALGRAPEDARTTERMRHKLRTAGERAPYDKRKVTAKPVCGRMKDVIGLRQILLRGLANVWCEWRLGCTAHNLLKPWRACRSGVTASARRTAGRPAVVAPAA